MKIKKVISLILALTLMLNVLPTSSFATDTTDAAESIVIASVAGVDEDPAEANVESTAAGADAGTNDESENNEPADEENSDGEAADEPSADESADDEDAGDESDSSSDDEPEADSGDDTSDDAGSSDEETSSEDNTSPDEDASTDEDEDTSTGTYSLLAVASEDYSGISGIVGTPVDLTDSAYISLVVTANGQVVDSSTAYDRDTVYTFTFTYDFHDGYDPTPTQNTVYYELPDSVLGEIQEGNHNLYNSRDGSIIGSYVIQNGVVYLIFDTTWLAEHSDITGTFAFSAALDSSFTDGESEVIVQFEGVTDITIKLEDGEVTGEKKYVINDDGTITFTITLNISGTAADNFTLTDTIGSNLSFTGSFYLDNTDVSSNFSVNGSVATGNLGTLALGTHVITYTVNVIDTDNLSDTTNNATWTWNGGSGGIDEPTKVTFQKSSISKSGNVTELSDGSLLIVWTIWVTPDQFSTVFGTTITDTPASGQTFTGDITISRGYWPDVYTGSVSDFVNSSGQLVYTFPSSFTYGSNTYDESTDKGEAYRIIYYTTVAADDVPSSTTKYTNSVTDDDGNTDEGEATYYPSSTPTVNPDIVSKSGTGNAGSTPTASFTITIDPTQYSGVDNMILNDMLTDSYSGAYVQSSLTVKGASGKTYTSGTDYSISWTSSNRGFTIDFAVTLTEIVYITYDVTYQYQNSSEYIYGQNTVASEYEIEGDTYTEGDTAYVTIAELIDKTGTISENVATWTIVLNRNEWGNPNASLAGKTYYVTDTLPDGMSYVSGSATYTISGYNGTPVSGASITPSISGNVLTFTIDDLSDSSSNYGWSIITITYKTEITNLVDDDGDGVVTFTNSAQWGDGTDTFGDDEATVEVDEIILSKYAAIASGGVNQISYSIYVNQAADDLVSGDTVELSDTLSANASFLLDSITVVDMSGNAVGFTSSYTLNQDGTSTITLIVPDELAMVVTYTVYVTGNDGETVTVENVATLSGKDSTSDDTSTAIEIEVPEAYATGHNGSLTINKIDANDVSHSLPGATFDLYIYDLSTNTWSYSATEITDTNGELTFGKKNDGTSALFTNTLYYYVETYAPEGYELDSTKYYFIIKDDTGYDTYVSRISAYGYTEYAVYPYEGGKTVYVPNEAAAGSLAISKTVSNVDSDTQEFTFTITMASAAGNSYTAIKGSSVTTVDFNSSGVATITLKDDETITISGLPANASYTVTESTPTGYTLVSYSGNTGTIVKDQTVSASFTNELETTEIKVTKVWNDNEDQDGIRPTSVEVTLYKNGKATTTTLTLTSAGGWTGTFTDLPKYENGKLIEYEVVETAVKGYASESDSNADETEFTITNTHVPETISFEFSKVWDDNNDQDGIRPGSVTITLYCNGTTTGKSVTLSESNSWSGSFSDLPLYTGGVENVYTLVETEVTGYTWRVSSWVQSSSGVYTAVITNTHTPATVSISGEKIWDDNNDQDGKRPASITVNLLADGTVVDTLTVTPDSGGNWTYSFTGLDKYKDGGKEIIYTVKEEAVADYTTVYSSNSYDITNTHTPEETEITIRKVWNDADDQDGLRPLYVEVKLYANGSYYDTVSLNIGNSWERTITGLPKYSSGSEIVYTIEEITVTGYTTAITGDATTGFTITNTHTPEVTDVSVTKVWDDTGYETNRASYTVTLTGVANGTTIYTDVQTITSTDSGYTYTWSNLDKYYKGYLITYLVDETVVPNDYVKNVVQDSTYEFTITNTYSPEHTSVTVVKYWQDNGDQDGFRDSYEVTIIGKVGDTVVYTDSQTLSATDRTYTWTNLDKYYGGDEIVYTVDETVVPTGYTYTVAGDASTEFVITNIHTPEVTSVSITKVWDDGDNQDGIRPTRVVISLLANGTVYREVGLTVDYATDSNTWYYEFTNLPKYSNAKEIEYTVQEITIVSDYTASTPTGDADTGFTITNTHEVETVEISGTKTWDDADNQDGIRPTEITLYLLKNGSRTGVEITVKADVNGNWNYSFGEYPKYENGVLIQYSVEEEDVSGYTTTYHGYNITNIHTPETTSVSGRKSWRDGNNQYDTRPASITINLLAGGTKIDSVTVSASDNWAYSFDNLDKYKDGNLIEYTIEEEDVTGYTATVSGYNVINTLETTSVTAVKYWNDNGNQDGKRAEYAVTITGTAGGTTVYTDTQTLSAETTGYTWNNLPKYYYDANNNAEVEIVYTVEETSIPTGYDASYSTDDTTGIITITNTHEVETTDLTVKKIWNDNSDNDGIRPDSITINLLADGAVVDTITLTGTGDEWSYEWIGLDKYSAGVEIIYTVEEVSVSDYTTETDYSVSGEVTITNTHDSETTSVSVKKVWSDGNNRDNTRPDSVTVRLLADGTEYATVELNESNSWSYEWSGLTKYSAGTEIAYTVEEVDVPDKYTSSTAGSASSGYTITNTYEIETTEVSVTKVWNDAGDYDGIRPESITVVLYRNGEATTQSITLSETNNWSGSFLNLPVNDDSGNKITYTIAEVAVSGYTSSVSGNAVSGFTITNTHNPSEEPKQSYTDLRVKKVWEDDDDADGLRPSSVTIALYKNGVPTGRTVTLSEANNWTASFTHLEVYANNGTTKNVYTVEELNVPAGYRAIVSKDYAWQYTITNIHEREIVELEEPVESTDTETEDEGDVVTAEPESTPESNPVTGIALSILPMAIAALAAASSKRR